MLCFWLCFRLQVCKSAREVLLLQMSFVPKVQGCGYLGSLFFFFFEGSVKGDDRKGKQKSLKPWTWNWHSVTSAYIAIVKASHLNKSNTTEVGKCLLPWKFKMRHDICQILSVLSHSPSNSYLLTVNVVVCICDQTKV